MRSTRTTRSSLLAAAALAAGGAVAAAPAAADVLVAPDEQVISPAPTGYYLWQRANSQLVARTPVLWPDATVRVFDTQINPSQPSGPGYSVALDALGGAPLTTAADTPVPAGSLFGLQVALRRGFWDFEDAIVGVGGRNWLAEDLDDGPARTIISARDEQFSNVVAHRGRFGTSIDGGSTQLLMTAAGLRSVTFTPRDKSARFVIRDRSNRRIVSFPSLYGQAFTTPGGSLVVVGADGIRRVTARGRVKRVGGPLGPQPQRSRQWDSAQVVAVPNGAVVLYSSATGSSGLRIAKLTSSGRVRRSVALSDLPLPWSGACLAADGVYRSARISVDAAGQVVLNAACTGPSAVGMQQLVAELGPGFTLRRMIATSTDQYLVAGASLPDGRLVVAHASQNGETAWTIGAIPIGGATVVRGTGTLLGRGGSRPLRVRLRCKLAVGGICSGVATIRTAAGDVLGWAPYSLPGRPGRTETVFDRTIPLAAGQAAGLLSPNGRLPKGARVELTPLPEHLDRTALQPPVLAG